jgi:chromosome segregation ATPase
MTATAQNQRKEVVTEEVMNRLKKDIEKYKGLKIKAETRMEELLNQKKELEQEVIELGYDPKTLNDEIEKMNSEMESILEEIEELKPQI